MPFCPKCGSRIGDDEVFCKKCESSLKKVSVGGRKPVRAGAAKSRLKIGFAVGVLFLAGILLTPVNTQETYEVTETYVVKEPVTTVETYYEKEPYTITEPKSTILFSERLEPVPARDFRQVFSYIDPEGKTQNIVTGEISETTGNDISFYIFDKKNFNAWKEGKENKPYVSKERIKKFEFSFAPDHADDYIFVMDNGYSWLTPKIPKINAQWSWKEVKTGFKDVEKKRTVTSYQDVEKKRVVQKTRTVKKRIYEIVLEKFS